MEKNIINMCWIIGVLLFSITGTLVTGYPNLATSRPTSQSTIQTKQGNGAGTQLFADLAVDGNTDTTGETSPYCAQTNTESNPWWKVSLETSSHISEIKIFLRSDPWGSTLPSDYNIYLTDSGVCGTGNLCDRDPSVNNKITVTCAGVGQWVVICDNNRVILCEVEIYGCPKEYYGTNCDFDCAHCLNSYCNIHDEACPGECETKYWGNTCDEQCSFTNCGEPGCEKSSGLCISCKAGYWGNDCTFKCSNKCEEQICEQNSGQCSTCITGFYGYNCTTECSPTCGDQGCRHNDGKCLSCEIGHWGDTCTNACLGQCDESGCTQDVGLCHGCNDGIWGNQCTKQCPHQCERKRCTKNDGLCHVCNDGYWNSTCNKHCGKCLLESCDMNNGTCQSGCQDGYAPLDCVCSINCVNNTCDGISRNCTYGCTDGFFGFSCLEQCNANCVDNVCEIMYGDCSNGCTDGHWGGNCSKVCKHCKANKCEPHNGMCVGCVDNRYWGPFCQLCSDKCAGNLCKLDNGDCLNCSIGFAGEKCEEECPQRCQGKLCDQTSRACVDGCVTGYHSVICNESCSPNCLDHQCNQDDAVCISGCTSRYTGSLCMQEPPLTHEDITGTVSAGVVVPILLIAIVSVVTVLVIRRRRAIKSRAIVEGYDDIRPECGRETEKAETPICSSIQEETGDDVNVYGNVVSEDDFSSHQGISVDILGEKIRQTHHNRTVQDEFQKFPVGLLYPHEVGQEKVNLPKNRYVSTFPYDHSRVLLDVIPGQPRSDYINCNYIESLEGKRNYVAAQGPKTTTIADFWRMVWQLECGTVVMLSNLIEGGKKKCDRYWPASGKMLDVGEFTLKLNLEEERSFYAIRKIVLSHKDTAISRTVTQFQFTAWPDHGIADPLQLTKFHRHVKQYDITKGGPLVVHCSAGIGRTGTYIALDALHEFGQKHGRLDIPGFVVKMRHDRMNMIQTLEQYKLLYEALYEELMYPSSAIPSTSYIEEYPKISNGKPANQTKIDKEYTKVMTLRREYPDNEYKDAFSKENFSKNRDGTTIALEKYRPFLNTYVSGSTDYINAVTIPGSMKGSMYILTQIPLENTVFDFWRMMYDQESTVLVKLNDLPSDQPPVDILPDPGDPFTIGALCVARDVDSTTYADVVEHAVTITHKISKDLKMVKIFEVRNWEPSNDVPPSNSLLLELVEKVTRWQGQVAHNIVTVMCLNGSTCSGLYCAVSKLLETLTKEQEVDVYQTAREIQYRCPQCLNSVEQYRFCYQAIKVYLSKDDVYANM